MALSHTPWVRIKRELKMNDLMMVATILHAGKLAHGGGIGVDEIDLDDTIQKAKGLIERVEEEIISDPDGLDPDEPEEEPSLSAEERSEGAGWLDTLGYS